jgi:trans-aconitate 2-methyltransferase
MSDWDATTYNRLSEPQVEWGRRVMLRLAPRSHESVLDLGCGTGRLTTEIAMLVPHGVVIGVDRSASMLAVARQAAAGFGSPLQPAIRYVQADGVALPFRAAFDAVFSTATAHWIRDHPALFRSVLASLRPGGRLVAQCGGGANLERLYSRAAILMRTAPFATAFRNWQDPWHFASADDTHEALVRCGYTGVHVGLDPAPVSFPGGDAYTEFITCVCIRHHLDRLPEGLRRGFALDLTRAAAADDPPFTLDYWRLNIDALRPAA